MCAPRVARNVDVICQAASVFIQCEDGILTYRGCSICKKSWPGDGAQLCSCAGAAQTNYWRSHLTLTDHIGQVKATCFDAFESVAMFADECALPDNYVHEAARQELLLSIAAVPFTDRQVHLPVYTHTYIRACRRAGALPSPVLFLVRSIPPPSCASCRPPHFSFDGTAV